MTEEFKAHRDYTSEYSNLEDLPTGEWLVIVTDCKGPMTPKGKSECYVIVEFEEVVPVDDERVPRGRVDFFTWNRATGEFTDNFRGKGRWKDFVSAITEDDIVTRTEIKKAAVWIRIEKKESRSFITRYLAASPKDIQDANDYREYREKVTGGV